MVMSRKITISLDVEESAFDQLELVACVQARIMDYHTKRMPYEAHTLAHILAYIKYGIHFVNTSPNVATADINYGERSDDPTKLFGAAARPATATSAAGSRKHDAGGETFSNATRSLREEPETDGGG